jgi:hypothetical protein
MLKLRKIDLIETSNQNTHQIYLNVKPYKNWELVDKLQHENHELKQENQSLKQQIQNQNMKIEIQHMKIENETRYQTLSQTLQHTQQRVETGLQGIQRLISHRNFRNHNKT